MPVSPSWAMNRAVSAAPNWIPSSGDSCLPSPLTAQEIAALIWAVKQAGGRQPFRGAISTALGKLQGLVPVSQGRLAMALDGVLGGWDRGVKDYAGLEATILQLMKAIVERRRCLLGYQAPWREKPNRFRYDPYRLLSVHGGLYCIGKVPVHGDFVTLAVDRIRSFEETNESFTQDPGFDPKRYEAEAFGVVWEKPKIVVIRFSADQAPYVRERQWHPSQKIRTLRDGRLELTFRAGGTFEITRWILGWGSSAEVLRPASLRKEVLAALQAALGYYGPHRQGSESETSARRRRSLILEHRK